MQGRNFNDLILNNVSNVFSFYELLRDKRLVFIDNNFFNVSILSFNSDNFFFNGFDLLNFLDKDRNFNRLVSEFAYNSIDFTDDRDLDRKFNDLGNLNNLFFKMLNFIDFGNIVVNGNQFFNDGGNLNNTVLCLNNRLSNLNLHLLDLLIVVRYNLFDFLQDFSDNWFLNDSFNLLHTDIINFNLNDILDFLNNLNKFFNFSVNWNDNLNDFVDRDWNFNRYDGRSFDFNDFFYLDNLRDDSIDLDLSGNLNSGFNNFFRFFLYNLHYFNCFFDWNDLVNEFLNYSINLGVDVVDLFNFDNAVLDDRHLNQLFNLSYFFNFNSSVHNFFDDLWYFNNLFNNSGNDNNFFNDFLNFHNLGNFDHLFNDFVDVHTNFLDSFNSSGYFNDLFNNNLDRVVLGNEVVNWLFNFDDLWYFNNLIDFLLHFNDLGNLCSLNDDLSHYFRYSHNFFLNNGNFNSSVNNFFDFLDHGNGVVDNSFNFFYSVSIDNLFFNHLDLFDRRNFNLNLDDLFNGLGNFYYLLDGLDDGDGFLDNDLDYFRDGHRLVDDLSCTLVLGDFDWFFNDSVKWFYNFNNSLNYFFLDFFHFNNFSNDLFNRDDLFLDDLNFLDFRNGMVNDFLDNNRLLNFNNLLLNDFNFYDLGNFNNSFDYLLNDSGNFNDLFSVLRYFYNLLDDVINSLDDFNGNMDNLLDFLNLDNFNWSLDNLLNRNHLRNLNDSVHDLFNNFFDFDDLGDHSEDFQDVININNSHDLSVNHSNNSLIDVQDKSAFLLDFFKLFKKSLDQNSEMELNFS